MQLFFCRYLDGNRNLSTLPYNTRIQVQEGNATGKPTTPMAAGFTVYLKDLASLCDEYATTLTESDYGLPIWRCFGPTKKNSQARMSGVITAAKPVDSSGPMITGKGVVEIFCEEDEPVCIYQGAWDGGIFTVDTVKTHEASVFAKKICIHGMDADFVPCNKERSPSPHTTHLTVVINNYVIYIGVTPDARTTLHTPDYIGFETFTFPAGDKVGPTCVMKLPCGISFNVFSRTFAIYDDDSGQIFIGNFRASNTGATMSWNLRRPEKRDLFLPGIQIPLEKVMKWIGTANSYSTLLHALDIKVPTVEKMEKYGTTVSDGLPQGFPTAQIHSSALPVVTPTIPVVAAALPTASESAKPEVSPAAPEPAKQEPLKPVPPFTVVSRSDGSFDGPMDSVLLRSSPGRYTLLGFKHQHPGAKIPFIFPTQDQTTFFRKHYSEMMEL